MRRISICLFLPLILIQVGLAQERDGKLFDPGVTMTEPADGAPDQLDRALFLLGQWDVEYAEYRADTLFRSGSGLSSVTLMNRGHAIMERFYCDGCAENELDINILGFLAYNTGRNSWNLGEANSFKEVIEVFDGGFEGGELVLRNSVRTRGLAEVEHYRLRYSPLEEGTRTVVIERSKDFGETWSPHQERTYRLREPEEVFLTGSDRFGSPTDEQPEEARAFDFLIGVFDAAQELTLPNGQTVNFPSTTTAVFALDGHAVLEYGWYDVDPNLPDAATSIIRLYNRMQGRWESLYMTNRQNAALYFGGYAEDDRIVLGWFNAHLDTGPINHFVFHDIKKDEYHWYGEQSTDRGETWQKTWIIDMSRREGNEL